MLIKWVMRWMSYTIEYGHILILKAYRLQIFWANVPWGCVQCRSHPLCESMEWRSHPLCETLEVSSSLWVIGTLHSTARLLVLLLIKLNDWHIDSKSHHINIKDTISYARKKFINSLLKVNAHRNKKRKLQDISVQKLGIKPHSKSHLPQTYHKLLTQEGC